MTPINCHSPHSNAFDSKSKKTPRPTFRVRCGHQQATFRCSFTTSVVQIFLLVPALGNRKRLLGFASVDTVSAPCFCFILLEEADGLSRGSKRRQWGGQSGSERAEPYSLWGGITPVRVEFLYNYTGKNYEKNIGFHMNTPPICLWYSYYFKHGRSGGSRKVCDHHECHLTSIRSILLFLNVKSR